MTASAELPAWVALLTALLVVGGAALTLIGSLGLLRLRSFYERVHAPTLGTSLGTASIVLAAILSFSSLTGRPVLHALLIAVFVTLTTPVTLMLLARATLYRERLSGASADKIPPPRDHAE